MPISFPAMDPYLDAHWGDVHARLVIYIGESQQSALPRDLRVRVEERVFVVSDQNPSQGVRERPSRLAPRLGRDPHSQNELTEVEP